MACTRTGVNFIAIDRNSSSHFSRVGFEIVETIGPQRVKIITTRGEFCQNLLPEILILLVSKQTLAKAECVSSRETRCAMHFFHERECIGGNRQTGNENRRATTIVESETTHKKRWESERLIDPLRFFDRFPRCSQRHVPTDGEGWAAGRKSKERLPVNLNNNKLTIDPVTKFCTGRSKYLGMNSFPTMSLNRETRLEILHSAVHGTRESSDVVPTKPESDLDKLIFDGIRYFTSNDSCTFVKKKIHLHSLQSILALPPGLPRPMQSSFNLYLRN